MVNFFKKIIKKKERKKEKRKKKIELVGRWTKEWKIVRENGSSKQWRKYKE
jgi:hypothetical protein